MTINYALFENHLTSDPEDYAAQVRITGSAGLEVVAQRMVDQGSTVTKPDILAVLEDAIKAIESCLLDGNRVQLGGLCELFPRIKGVFNGITDTFDASRHRVDVGANPGARVRKTVREGATVTKTETIKPAPALLEYVDLGSGETNGKITSGNIGTINGHRLKFNPDQNDNGIYFVNIDTAAEVKVTTIQKNKPGQLVFLAPGMPDGQYYLEVRTRFRDSAELRTGRLDEILESAEPAVT